MRRMLTSAKLNLAQLAFFGLTEFLFETQYLFTWTFDLKFKKDITSRGSAHFSLEDIGDSDLQRVAQINKYDRELYKFGRELFFKRLRYAMNQDISRGVTVHPNITATLDLVGTSELEQFETWS